MLLISVIELKSIDGFLTEYLEIDSAMIPAMSVTAAGLIGTLLLDTMCLLCVLLTFKY